MKNQLRFWGVCASALLIGWLLLAACSGGMSDDEKEIAIAVALTQTAAAGTPDNAATPLASGDVAATLVATGVVSTTTAPVTATAAVTPTVTPTPAEVVAASGDETTTATAEGAAALTGDQLPVTQNSLKVRTLLVAPGEPGALYALLTDAAADSEPAVDARFLISRDFGVSWEAAPSGLPVAEDCLLNINMDYYGATALYASTCQGLYRWSEGGDWTRVSEEQTGMVAVVYGNDNILFATRPRGVEGAALLLSQNGGESWQELEIAHTEGVAAVGISPRDSRSGYAIVWPDGEGSNLRRGSIVQAWQTMPSPNGGATVTPGMTIDGGTGWLYVTTADDSGDQLWRSTDPDTPLIDDVSWQEVYRFSPGLTVQLLASGWSSEAEQLAIYANLAHTVDGETRYTLVRSLDNGLTWAPLIIDAG